MATIAYQLYCSRNFGPLDKTLSMLAKAGFTATEGYGGLYDQLDALKAGLDANGLTMPSGHFAIDTSRKPSGNGSAFNCRPGTRP